MIARIGHALVAPRAALASAGERVHAGRSGSDLVGLLVMLVIAAELRSVVGAIWLAVAVDLGSGARGVARVLTQSLTIDLAFLVVAALVLFVAAGAKRELGRAFDLACVAAIPLVLVHHGASVVLAAFEVRAPAWLGWIVLGVALAWAGALVGLGIRVLRATDSPVAGGHSARARAAGWGVVALAAAGLVVQTVWIAGHLEWMKPVTEGDRAVPLALPVIDRDGDLGPLYTTAPGRIVVVDFWATWCTPCLQALPKLDRLAREYADDVDVVAVNMDDAEAAWALWTEKKYVMILLADDGATSQRYGVAEIPHTVVIDRDGTVRGVYRGSASTTVERAVREILK